MKKLLTIENLNKTYYQKKDIIHALKNISLKVNAGDFIALVGPSGCGKSTILSILCGIVEKTSGNITYNKKNITIGYMLQNDSLFPWLTILNNCLLGLKIKKKVNKNNKEKVINLLKMYGLKDFIHHYPNSLSGGMRQRVALIRTLALNPDILLLDEPFSALDYQTRLAVSDDVYKIIKKEKKTTIMVTHDISEAISMADKIVVLSNRPAIIKNIYNINLTNKSAPIENRKAKEFANYYSKIWKDLDIHV
ncbi:MAG: ABC transporter ATP-binding protein [Bacilli bacterium]|jgi:NitT/TauT family transport system ATP-binding protein